MAAAPPVAPVVLPPPPPVIVPAGLGNVNAGNVVEWIAGHLNPAEAQRNYIFTHILPELNHVFTVCRLLPKQKIAIIRQGVTELEELPMLGNQVSDLRDLLGGFNRMTDARGGTIFGAAQYTRLHASILFVKDKVRRGQPVNYVDFTPAVMAEYAELSMIGKSADDDMDLELKDPPKLTDMNFLEWEEALLKKLDTKRGVQGIPLSYCVRRPLPPGKTIADITDPRERLVYEATQQGHSFRRDNMAVGQYIGGILAGQDASAWIENHMSSHDGRAMMNDLLTHFLGASQVEKIIEQARKKRDGAHYRNEGSYTFQRFATDLKRAFTVLWRYDNRVPDREQVRLLREKIQTDNASFNAAVVTTLLREDLATFDLAVAEVQRLVNHFFPRSQDKKTRFQAKISGGKAADFADKHENG